MVESNKKLKSAIKVGKADANRVAAAESAVKNLDKTVHGLRNRYIQTMKQIEEDEKELAWINGEVARIEPKLEACRTRLSHSQALKRDLESHLEQVKSTIRGFISDTHNVRKHTNQESGRLNLTRTLGNIPRARAFVPSRSGENFALPSITQ
eukprot:Rmarinus@m.640